MYPETLILCGAALGLAVANVVMRVRQSEWWHRKSAVWWSRRLTRPSRLRQVRRTTREAQALADARRSGAVPAVIPERGRHRRGRAPVGAVGTCPVPARRKATAA